MLKILFTHSSKLHKFAFLFLFLASSLVLQAQQPTLGVDGKSSFTAKLMNIEAATNETFRYTTTLHNGTNKPSIYELKAGLPIGWTISYKVDGNQVTSLNMDAGKTQDITIEINALATASPSKYRIPIKAVSTQDTLLLNLEAVVKGSYRIILTTPTGRLSNEVTSGNEEEIKLTVKNTGTLPLNEVEITAQLPTGWESSFEPSKIKQLEPGKAIDVIAKLKVPDKTIAGDYAATFTATNSNANAPAAFRLMVKTSLLSGWIGIAVILLAVGAVYYLIRKYGRR
jgi:uncharacterized membrane protein